MHLYYSNKYRFFLLVAITMVIVLLPSFLPLYITIILIAAIGVIILFLIKEQSILYYGIPFLIIYQIYIPFRITMSISVVLLFITFAYLLLKREVFNFFRYQQVLKFYFLMILLMVTPLFYSPDRILGIKLLFLTTVGLLALCLGYFYRTKDISINTLFKNFVLLGIPAGITNILFLVFPDLELRYLQSSIARLFIEPSTLNLINSGDLKNNILDPYKAGTLFVNTNVASAFFGFLFSISCSMMLIKWEKKYILSTIIFFGAILATQSRSGLLAAALVIFLFVILRFQMKVFMKVISSLLLLSGIIFISVPQEIIDNLFGRLNSDVVSTDPRALIWKFGFDRFLESPFAGLGYGGWEKSFPFYAVRVGVNPTFPPHNMYLILWSWAGLVTLIIFIAILLSVLFKSVKKYMKNEPNTTYLFAIIGSVTFVIVQGMFENFILHNFNIASLFFFLVGICIYNSEDKNETRIT